MDNPSRYEVVPKKESKFGKAFKNLGKYFKGVFKTQVESFKYNRMKFPGILLALPGILIGSFLRAHAGTVKQLTYIYSSVQVSEDGKFLTKVTNSLPGMPFDYTGIVIFILMLLGIFNIFVAINVANKQNLGSVVTASIITILMIALSAAYIYAVLYFKKAITAGVPLADGTNFKLVVSGGTATFDALHMPSIICVAISCGCSLIGCIGGFIHYNRAYEKVKER